MAFSVPPFRQRKRAVAVMFWTYLFVTIAGIAIYVAVGAGG
jgi:hypothetical protein